MSRVSKSTFSPSSAGHSVLHGFRALFLGGALSVALGAGGAMAADFLVEVNQARALKLSKPITSVMVGNPAIADVTLEGPDLLYVFGRYYGQTNLVALDADGNQVTNLDVSVVAAQGSMVTVTRGAGQASYNCTPRCERALDPTDSPEVFEPTLKGTKDITTMADESAAR